MKLQILGTVALIVNTGAFVTARLKGVSIETDYEVANQRNAIVASQAVGFQRIQAATAAIALLAGAANA